MTAISKKSDALQTASVDVAELKRSLNDYLKRVRAGEEIAIVDGDIVVGHLIPAPPDTYVSEEARLKDLERRGIIKRGTGKIPDEYWQLQLPQDPQGLVLAALLEEREQGW